MDLLKPPEALKKSAYFGPVRLTEGEVVIGTTTYKKLYTKHVLGHLEAFKKSD